MPETDDGIEVLDVGDGGPDDVCDVCLSSMGDHEEFVGVAG
jgi:hypothetical protein